MTIVDETLILRYLLDDDRRLSKQAHDVIAQVDASTFPEILARTVVTLRDVYQVPRSVISAAITSLLEDIAVEEEDVVRLATRLFGTSKLDYTDCLMVARNIINGDEVASFDKPLMKQVIAAEERLHAERLAERDRLANGGGSGSGSASSLGGSVPGFPER